MTDALTALIHREMGELADRIIAREVALQDEGWGIANENNPLVHSGQMVEAAAAQVDFVNLHHVRGVEHDVALNVAARTTYPAGWNGFRDYGSPIANLAVVAAYCRNEIKRRLAASEDATRVNRDGSSVNLYGA